MSTDWKDISDDELLNFDGSQSKEVIARYERIMQKRSIDKITGLMETIYRASQGFQEKTDQLLALYNRISAAQSRQQCVLIFLSLVVAASTAAYTWITWQSVAATREANEIQRQLLEFQKSGVVMQTAPNR